MVFACVVPLSVLFRLKMKTVIISGLQVTGSDLLKINSIVSISCLVVVVVMMSHSYEQPKESTTTKME